MSDCLLYDRECIECGECDKCVKYDRLCINCFECVEEEESDSDYMEILIDEIEDPTKTAKH